MANINFSILLLALTLFNISPTAHAKSVIEPCISSDSCPSLLSYQLPWDSKLSEIAYRFQLNISDILASNSIDPTMSNPSLWDQILPHKSVVKVPISCPCVDGIRRSLSTLYTVRAVDTVESISEGYGGLVSAEQIRSVNGMDGDTTLMSGDKVVIPLPCTCFGNSNDGVAVVYVSYVVQRGETLRGIALQHGTTVTELVEINGLAQPQVDPRDILAIPIPGLIFDRNIIYTACSSKTQNWYNESLIVPSGSYALTANNCIKCTCESNHLNLQCLPSNAVASCSHLQCKGSNLFIGDSIHKQTAVGCNITACVYRGHFGHKLFRSLENSYHAQCSGNITHSAESPSTLPPSIIKLSPFPSPSPSPSESYGPSGINALKQTGGNIYRNRGSMLTQASCFCLLFLQFSLSFSFQSHSS